jgi:P-type E1-E2 ATPase
VDYRAVRTRCQELGKVPYESIHAYAASVNQYQGSYEIFVKGSVERLLEMCAHARGVDSFSPARIERQASELAQAGYRVLGLARRRVNIVPAEPEEFLGDMEFIGIVGMIDPLRPEALAAVRKCHAASIKVAMITGDHPQTACAIALQLGIADEDMEPVTGQQIREAAGSGAKALHDLVESTRVFKHYMIW